MNRQTDTHVHRPISTRYTDISTYRHIDISIYRYTDILIYRNIDISTYRYTDISTYPPYTDILTYRHILQNPWSIDISFKIHGVRYNTLRARGHLGPLVGFPGLAPNPENGPKLVLNMCCNHGRHQSSQRTPKNRKNKQSSSLQNGCPMGPQTQKICVCSQICDVRLAR